MLPRFYLKPQHVLKKKRHLNSSPLAQVSNSSRISLASGSLMVSSITTRGTCVIFCQGRRLDTTFRYDLWPQLGSSSSSKNNDACNNFGSFLDIQTPGEDRCLNLQISPEKAFRGSKHLLTSNSKWWWIPTVESKKKITQTNQTNKSMLLIFILIRPTWTNSASENANPKNLVHQREIDPPLLGFTTHGWQKKWSAIRWLPHRGWILKALAFNVLNLRETNARCFASCLTANGYPATETNSRLASENGWLEDFLVSFWGPAYFQGQTCWLRFREANGILTFRNLASKSPPRFPPRTSISKSSSTVWEKARADGA